MNRFSLPGIAGRQALAWLMLACLALASCDKLPAPEAGQDGQKTTEGQGNPARGASTALKPDLYANWQIRYEDKYLGIVSGTVALDLPLGAAVFEFADPITGELIKLKAKSVSATENGLTVVLPPGSPSARVKQFGVSDRVETEGFSVKLSLGEGETSQPLATRDVATGDVTIELTYHPEFDWLSGHWTQQLDSSGTATGTAAGRAGQFRFGPPDEGGASVSGREAWYRPPPDIKSVFAIGEQFATTITGPDWPAPFEPGTGTRVPRAPDTRHLMVVGKFLPRNIREDTTIESLDEHIRYRVYRTRDSYDGLPKEDRIWKDKAEDQIATYEALGKMAYEPEPDDEEMIVEATLLPGVMPGFKGMRINGTETEWLLRFGDHRAGISFARDFTQELRSRPDIDYVSTPVQTEPVDIAFEGDEIYVEVRAQKQLPMASLPIVIMKSSNTIDWAPILFNEKRQLVALPINPEMPVRYRTPPIRLLRSENVDALPDGALAIPVRPGDSLRAFVAGDPVLALSPGLAQAPVLDGPEDVHSLLSGNWDETGILWPEAVGRALKCADLGTDLDDDIQTMTRETADYFVDTAPIEVGRHIRSLVSQGRLSRTEAVMVTEVNIGEHAAMIMMREMLIDMLTSVVPAYEIEFDDDSLLAMHESMKDIIVYDPKLVQTDLGEIGLNKVRVPEPGGGAPPNWAEAVMQTFFTSIHGTTHLDTSYYDATLKEQYGLDGPARLQYKIDSMRSARKLFAQAIHKSIELAGDIDECDVYELLKLTGLGLGPVRHKMSATLMTQIEGERPGVDRWVPDWKARIHVDGVARVAEGLFEQEGISSSQWTLWLTTISLLTWPLGVAEGSPLLLRYAAAAYDITDAAQGLYTVATQVGLPLFGDGSAVKEQKFALGATAILGTGRYQEAPAIGAGEKLLMLMPSLFLANRDIMGEITDRTFSKLLFTRKFYRIPFYRPTVNMARRGWNQLLGRASLDDLAAHSGLVHELRTLQRNLPLTSLEPREIQALTRLMDKRGTDRINLRELAGSQTDRQSPIRDFQVTNPRERPAGVYDQLSEPAYERARVLRRYAQFRQFVEAAPGKIDAYVMDDDSFRLLHLKHRDLAAFEEAVRQSKQQARPAVWTIAPRLAESDAFPFDDVFAHQGIYFGRIQPGYNEATIQSVRLDVHSGRDTDRFYHAIMERSVVPDTVFGTGKNLYRFDDPFGIVPLPFADPIPGQAMVKIADAPQAPEIPLALAAELRVYKSLRLDFADASIGGYQFQSVVDRRLAAEVAYMRSRDPELELTEAFRRTTWFHDVNNLAGHLGFKVVDIDVPSSGIMVPLASVPDSGSFEFPTRAEIARRMTEQHSYQDEVARLYDPDQNLIVETAHQVNIKLEAGSPE